MLITNPGVQKPHWLPCARARRSCTGCNPERLLPMPAQKIQSLVPPILPLEEIPNRKWFDIVACVVHEPEAWLRIIASTGCLIVYQSVSTGLAEVLGTGIWMLACRIPSTVTTCMPSTEYRGHKHAFTERCSSWPSSATLLTMTVQAPQPPSPHPNFVPVKPISAHQIAT